MRNRSQQFFSTKNFSVGFFREDLFILILLTSGVERKSLSSMKMKNATKIRLMFMLNKKVLFLEKLPVLSFICVVTKKFYEFICI